MAQFNSLLVTGDSRFINMINGACSDCYGTCTTATATVAKVATITNTATFNLSVGTTVHIKFSNYNSATNPTLNVNSTGAYPIVKFGTTAVGTGTSTTWRSGATCTLTFDGTSWVLHEYDPYCVGQSNVTGNYNYQLLMSGVSGTETDAQYTTTTKSAKLYYNPSTGKLYANSSEVALKSQIPTTASDIGALPDTTKYAGSSSVGGSATSAVKLDTSTAGTLTKPCYFSGGKPAACTYELKATVPEDAKFTDTWRPIFVTTGTATASIPDNVDATFIAGNNVSLAATQTGAITVSATDTTYSAGTGLSISGTTINHSNSITAKTTQAVYPVKIDAQGHITAVGTAATILALGNGASNAYYGDKGKTAYDHSQVTSGNPHNVTKSDVGLGNVGNFKAVSTVASQGLTDTEKSNARTNIGAGTVTSVTIKATSPVTIDSSTAITGSGTRTIGLDTVPIANGGTGATTKLGATDNLSALYGLTGGTLLVADQDCDSLTVGKTYYSDGSTLSGKVVHPPTTSSGFKIYTLGTYHSNYTAQIAFLPSGGICTRGKYKDGSNYPWTGWRTLYHTDNLISQPAASGGTTKSLVTTGEKYTWNNKVNRAGDTMTGNLTIKMTSTHDDNSPSCLLLRTVDSTNNVTSTGYIMAYDGGANGANLVIQPGGNMFLGSGEAANNHYLAAYTHSTTETMYITSDGGIHIQANGQTIANRVGAQIDTSGNLVPEKADVATTNIGGIGTSTYKWADGYFTNINGVTVGDSPKFTDTTYTGTGLITVNSSTHVISTSATANTGTVTKVSTGAGLVGGDIQTTGTIKCALKSETVSTLASASITSTSSRQYAVNLDKNSVLSVNVPWSNTYTSAYCSTAGDTTAKVGTCTGYTLLNKSWLHVTLTNSNSVQGAITLNVNSKGAKAIYINGKASSSSNHTLPAGTYLVYYADSKYYFRTDGNLFTPPFGITTYTLSTVTPLKWSSGYALASQSGSTVQIIIQLLGSGSAATGGTDAYHGTLTSGPLPARDMTLIGYTGSTVIMGWLTTTGDLTARPMTNVTVGSGSGIYLTGTFIGM